LHKGGGRGIVERKEDLIKQTLGLAPSGYIPGEKKFQSVKKRKETQRRWSPSGK